MTVVKNEKLRQEVLTRLIVKYEGCVLEHDSNTASFLLDVQDFFCILQIEIGKIHFQNAFTKYKYAHVQYLTFKVSTIRTNHLRSFCDRFIITTTENQELKSYRITSTAILKISSPKKSTYSNKNAPTPN